MRIVRRSLAVCLAILFMAPAVKAQDHVIGKSALDKAVQERVSRDQADRDAITSLLQRSQVRDIAASAGISLDKAQLGVSALEGSELQALASQARQVQNDLAGGLHRGDFHNHHHHRPVAGHTDRRARRLTRKPIISLWAATVIAVVALSSGARAQAPSRQVHLLDVPYMPQSEALCGGAAAAMVMRYWGATGVYAETFADLVIQAAGGIRGDDLLRALKARGWDARSFRGDAALVQAQLAARRPTVALIEDRPGRLHYVVVVGWSNGRVVAHDPARAPFRVLDESAFVQAWAKTDYWTMLAVPGETPDVKPTAEAAPAGGPPRADGGRRSPCSAMVDEGVRLAGAGQTADALRLFQLAADACPESAGPWREMAGVHALREEWAEAAADARRAIGRDATDEHAWRILAASLYLQDDPDGALAAWNQIGEPQIDLVDIKGLDRTGTRLRTGSGSAAAAVLTPSALRQARQRLAQLPSAQTTRVAFRPGENGVAQVEAIVVERPLLPVSRVEVAAGAVRLATDRELRVAISSPAGGGEVWRASWRWWERRPSVSASFHTPAPFGGVWGVTVLGERETYSSADSTVEERRQTATLGVSRWTGPSVRLDTGLGFDRWSSSRRGLSLSAGVHRRLASDRAFVEGKMGVWGRRAACVDGEWPCRVAFVSASRRACAGHRRRAAPGRNRRAALLVGGRRYRSGARPAAARAPAAGRRDDQGGGVRTDCRACGR